MATTKITITLPNDQLEGIRAKVAAGAVSSVSGFIKHAVKIALEDAAGFRKMLNEALEQTGGPLTKEERAWAEEVVFGRKAKGGSRRRNAA